MELEEYFDFLAPDDIRIKGHRVGIETILFDYLDGLSPEEMVLRYPTLSLNEINATIRYYQKNWTKIDAYLREIEEHTARMQRQQEENPPPGVKRLRAIAEERRRASLIGAHVSPDR